MFEKEYNLGFSTLDKKRQVKFSSIMNVLQDVSFEHAENAGLDYKKLKRDFVALLLSGWRVRLHKPLSQGTVTARTGIMSLGSCDAVRRYELYQNGECCVSATAIWFTVDTSVRGVTRIPESYASAFESISEPDNGLPYGRIMPCKSSEFVEEFTVEPRDIDANNHFNNVKSIEKMLNLLPLDAEVAELQIKYRKEVRLGDKVRIFGDRCENRFYFEIRNKDNAVCTYAYVNIK